MSSLYRQELSPQASSSLFGSLPAIALSLPLASQQPSIQLPGSPHGALLKPGSDHFTFLQNMLQLGSSLSFPHPRLHSNLNTYLRNRTKLSIANPTHHMVFLPLGLQLTTHSLSNSHSRDWLNLNASSSWKPSIIPSQSLSFPPGSPWLFTSVFSSIAHYRWISSRDCPSHWTGRQGLHFIDLSVKRAWHKVLNKICLTWWIPRCWSGFQHHLMPLYATPFTRGWRASTCYACIPVNILVTVLLLSWNCAHVEREQSLLCLVY